MKFGHINIKNAIELIPSWIIDPIQLMRSLDILIAEYIRKTGLLIRGDMSLPFSIELLLDGDKYRINIVDHSDSEPWPFSARGMMIIEAKSPLGGDCLVNLPFNPFLRKADSIKDKHCVYRHIICTETPLAYTGITCKRWFDRLTQHANDAARGSPYLFHEAIRNHSEVKKGHVVILAGLDKNSAMNLEEEWVSMSTLYPLGLNMIPGGYAGIRYLGKLGVSATTPAERDAAVERLSARETVNGLANPLCAARWVSDQDYVNRVICGHSGRLTVDQVRTIRLLNAFGINEGDIANRVDASTKKVMNVLSGARYGRVN